MKSIGEALRAIVPAFEPTGGIRLPLLSTLGRVLYEDVRAGVDLPRFDNSAMDGYAVRHAELQVDAALPICGESRAGGEPPGPLPRASALRIFTGAPLPEGADTVVMQEHARWLAAGDAQPGGRAQPEGGLAARVAFSKLPTAGANVRARGSDLARGSVALARGQALGPGELGLLAALGQHAVSVYRPPRVAIVSVGDELREIGQDLEPGTVVSSNAYALAAQLTQLGCEPWQLPIARDDLDAIVATLEHALRADVVLSSGGVSVGDYDLMGAAFARVGVVERFAKVAVKPGKPLWFGMSGRVPVVGLPGNPVSAMVTFELFVRPALRRMLGHPAPYPSLITVELAHAHRHGTGRVELARAQLTARAEGPHLARLSSQQGSGSLPSMVTADALVELPAETEAFAPGCRLRALPLHGLYCQTSPAFD